MPTWYAQQNSVNINAANVWNSAANGSGTWLTWAALGPTDVLMWNGRTNITINVSVLCASLRCSNFGGATAGGSGTIANGVTITADLYGSGNSNNFLSITGSANCTIIGSLYGHDVSAAILTVSSSGTIAITGNLIGGSLSTSRSECLRQSAGVVIITGEITNALNVAIGIPTVSLSGGTLNVVGNITGGGGSANSADAVTVTGGTLNVTGNVQGGTGWQGVTIGGSGTVVVNGSSIAGTYPAIMSSVNTPTARAICNGDMIAGANGCVAVSVPTLLINGSGALTHTYRTNNAGVAGVARSLYTGGVNIGQPAIANVRFGTQFGASSEYTGALRVPDPQYVSQGVLTDNTVGTLTGSLDATELRAAMGLASANLDTQLATINTRTSSIYSLLQLTDADVASIKTTVEGLVAAIWSAGTRTLTSISDSSGITTLLNRITALVRTKAEDDAADTLIRDDIAALSTTGDGARTVTPTVRVSGSPLENATIRFTLGGLTYAGKTNASGQKVFNLDDGTYAVSISKPGYTFAGTTLVVNGTETPIYDVTLNTPSSPPGADDCDLSFIVASQSNTPLTSITIEAKYVKGFHVTEGTLGINAVESTTPNESGEVTLRLLRNAEYDISATRGTKKVTVRITTPDESTAVLDESMVV
jgi:hypothetical protein